MVFVEEAKGTEHRCRDITSIGYIRRGVHERATRIKLGTRSWTAILFAIVIMNAEMSTF